MNTPCISASVQLDLYAKYCENFMISNRQSKTCNEINLSSESTICFNDYTGISKCFRLA